MGIYFRADRGTWWLKIPTGGAPPYTYRETVYRQEQEAKAQETYDQVVGAMRGGRRWDHLLSPDMTLRAYGRGWSDDREKAGKASVRAERGHLEHHIYPARLGTRPNGTGGTALGDFRLADVKPRHVEELVEQLKKKLRAPKSAAEKKGEVPVTEVLSARMQHHIVGTLRTLYFNALADELVEANPVKIRPGILPKKNKDRKIRRSQAVFVREEVEQLISDERIPLDRRTLYGLLFLSGRRPGEAVIFRWRDYDTAVQPLGRLYVDTAWSTELKKEKGTKTEEPSEVPVHPTLAKLLASWKLEGWPRYFGRQPGPDDFLIPARMRGTSKKAGPGDTNRKPGSVYNKLMEDLPRVGLRHRRLYDSRRTFISIARSAGVAKDQLRWITHGVRLDILDDYTTPTWDSLCEAVNRIKIGLLEGRLHQLRQVATDGSAAGPSGASSCAGEPLPADLGPAAIELGAGRKPPPEVGPRANSVTKPVTSGSGPNKKTSGSKNLRRGAAMSAEGIEPSNRMPIGARSGWSGLHGMRTWGAARAPGSGSKGSGRLKLVTAGNGPEFSPGCQECERHHGEFEALMLDGDLGLAGRALRELVEHCGAVHR